MGEEIPHRSVEPPSQISFRNVVSALKDPLSHPRKRKVRAGHPEEIDMDGVSLPFKISQQGDVSAPGKCGLKSEVLFALRIPAYLFEHQTAGPEDGRLRRERRNPLCDEVGVDEIPASCIKREKFPGKGRLAGSIRPSDKIEAAF